MNIFLYQIFKMKLKYFLIALLAVFVLSAAVFVFVLFVPNGQASSLPLVIPDGASYQQVEDSIQKNDWVRNKLTFRIAARFLNYNHVMKGKYVIDKNENNFEIIKKLRRGQHYPVKFTINNIRTKCQLLQKIESFHFLFDIADLETLLNDSSFLAKYDLTPATAIAVFQPNTYEFYYDISAQGFFEKMYGYYQKFWNQKRLEIADSMGFTPLEVATLASIVEEENFKECEKAIIAGLYINRLHQDLLLQADPTVKFALGDFSIKRVYEKHTQVDSPYNTYKYKGLPPGPIRIPAQSTIDSVLNYTHHNYIFMCAKEDFSGTHHFTNSYSQHLVNSRKYQRALSAME